MKGSILLVDDDRSMAEIIKPILSKAGYEFKHAEDTDEGYAFLKNETFDVLLLDLNLPGVPGMKFLEIIKQEPKNAQLPVIVLTAKGDIQHKVQGLETGADDYLVKPFSSKELLARIEALLRRVKREGQPENVLSREEITVDFDRSEVRVKDKRIELTPAEFEILAILMKRPGFTHSYQVLAEQIAKGSKDLTSDIIYTHIKNLRKKLGARGELIATVHGVGYKFVEP